MFRQKCQLACIVSRGHGHCGVSIGLVYHLRLYSDELLGKGIKGNGGEEG